MQYVHGIFNRREITSSMERAHGDERIGQIGESSSMGTARLSRDRHSSWNRRHPSLPHSESLHRRRAAGDDAAESCARSNQERCEHVQKIGHTDRRHRGEHEHRYMPEVHDRGADFRQCHAVAGQGTR